MYYVFGETITLTMYMSGELNMGNHIMDTSPLIMRMMILTFMTRYTALRGWDNTGYLIPDEN